MSPEKDARKRPPGGGIPAVLTVPISGPKDPAKAKQSVKRFLERVEGLGAGQQATQGLLREILENVVDVRDMMKAAAAVAAAANSERDKIQRASREEVTEAVHLAAQPEQQLGAAHKEGADSLSRVRLLEAEVAALRGQLLVAQQRQGHSSTENSEDDPSEDDPSEDGVGRGFGRHFEGEGEVEDEDDENDEDEGTDEPEATLHSRPCLAANAAQLRSALPLHVHTASASAEDAFRRPSLGAFDSLQLLQWRPRCETLHQAARYGDKLEVLRLVAAGADVNAADEDGNLPLALAAAYPRRHSAVEAVRALLLSGAEMDAKNADGQTALHAATWSGTVEVVRCLLLAGANVHVADKVGDRPLHIAARKGCTRMVRLLLMAGAEKHVHNRAGSNPYLEAPVGSGAERLLA
ncbi:Ankyrin repeat domain-containing protein 6 [Tetrabaena socialis]|uniref:Ankyrin repeat domain-containing protein 6 n=1 Tax=Tetrabaena socialis TaxID=47790 RepID=A0A2J8AAU1_9CHLO|nr:Ankyrin repeat domain-containing protein 6 [Tetrabaena socialis]|eukprot:PNH09635.1 Ankyrin repeat domain-containing protein 6 [Tetrabaena socialis]